jgi:hypothetical protein
MRFFQKHDITQKYDPPFASCCLPYFPSQDLRISHRPPDWSSTPPRQREIRVCPHHANGMADTGGKMFPPWNPAEMRAVSRPYPTLLARGDLRGTTTDGRPDASHDSADRRGYRIPDPDPDPATKPDATPLAAPQLRSRRLIVRMRRIGPRG